MSYEFYITPEEYAEAKKYGIDHKNLEQRIRQFGWQKERAMTTPVRKKNSRKHWAEIAKENGITYSTFANRINVLGWDEERAATEPLQDRTEVGRRVADRLRVIPCEYTELARANGILYDTFRSRVYRGWDYHKAATQPLRTAK